MKHGRRHNRLKEQAYRARKNAEGYGRPYEPMPADPGEAPAPEDVPTLVEADSLSLEDVLGRKARHALRHAQRKRDDA